MVVQRRHHRMDFRRCRKVTSLRHIVAAILSAMSVVISMLRGVNVGGHNKIKLEELRALYEANGLLDAQTYIQSGNVVFRTKGTPSAGLAQFIESAIEKSYGFRPDVMVRTATEMRSVFKRNPFSKRSDIEPNKLIVS